MDTGINKSLFTLIAVVIFGVFLSISYWMFQDEMKNVLASVFDSTSQVVISKIDYSLQEPTDLKHFTYKTNADGSYALTSYIGTDTDIVLPSEINGKPVTRIDNYFHNAYLTGKLKLTSISIPYTVTSIGRNALQGNRFITVDIPKSVKIIETWAFADSQIEYITLPDSLTSIGMYAFGCNRLKTITVPENVTYIGDIFVGNTSNLREINLPTSLRTLVENNPKIIYNYYLNDVLQPYTNAVINYY